MKYSTKSRSREKIRLLVVEDALDGSMPSIVQQWASDPHHLLVDLREAGPLLAEHGRPIRQTHQLLLGQTRAFGLVRHEHDAGVLVALVGLARDVPCYYEMKEAVEGISRRTIGRTVGESGKHAVGSLPEGDAACQAFCSVLVRSVYHVGLLDYAVGESGGLIGADKKVAQAVHTDLETLARVIADFQSVDVLRAVKGGGYKLDASGDAGKLISGLLTLWRHPTHRKKVMEWIKPLQAADQQRLGAAASERKKTGLFGKFFK